MKIGRNDPCPCGSGSKYKKCCAGKDEYGAPTGGLDAVMAELRKQVEGKNFASLEEAKLFAGLFMEQRNQVPIDDFHGLTSEQMHRFLHFPLDSPHLVSFPALLATAPPAPVVTLFQLLFDAIGESGLKPTATGNLPRQTCRDVALAFWGAEKYAKEARFGQILSEPDFVDLHVTRLLAEVSGLVRKYKGKFILGKECRKLVAEHGMAGVYPRLFQAFARKFNWGFRDRWQEIPLIQQSFLFTLHLLNRYGATWRASTFYEDCFLQAFPQLLHEAQPLGEYLSAETVLRRCYALRCLENFAEFMGMAEIERDPADRYADSFRIRKLPLLEHTVEFHLSTPSPGQ
jgi:hypothetical protein